MEILKYINTELYKPINSWFTNSIFNQPMLIGSIQNECNGRTYHTGDIIMNNLNGRLYVYNGTEFAPLIQKGGIYGTT